MLFIRRAGWEEDWREEKPLSVLWCRQLIGLFFKNLLICPLNARKLVVQAFKIFFLRQIFTLSCALTLCGFQGAKWCLLGHVSTEVRVCYTLPVLEAALRAIFALLNKVKCGNFYFENMIRGLLLNSSCTYVLFGFYPMGKLGFLDL